MSYTGCQTMRNGTIESHFVWLQDKRVRYRVKCSTLLDLDTRGKYIRRRYHLPIFLPTRNLLCLDRTKGELLDSQWYGNMHSKK